MWTQDLIDNPWLIGSPTFGGNPVCCAVAIATIKYMPENDIPGVCRTKGEFLKAGLTKLAEKYPEIIQEVRGTGLILAWNSTPVSWVMNVPKAYLQEEL